MTHPISMENDLPETLDTESFYLNSGMETQNLRGRQEAKRVAGKVFKLAPLTQLSQIIILDFVL